MVIALSIPHVLENIFNNLETDDLIQCLEVSPTWKIVAEKVLLKKWKGKMFEAWETGRTKVVKLLLEHYNCEENGLNVKNVDGWTSLMIVVKMLPKHPHVIDNNVPENRRVQFSKKIQDLIDPTRESRIIVWSRLFFDDLFPLFLMRDVPLNMI